MEWIKNNKLATFLAVLLIVIIALNIFQPNIGQKLLNKFNSDLRLKNEKLQKKVDSINRQREKDSIFYSQVLENLEAEKNRIQKRVDYANYKLRLYEDAFKDYNSGDFVPNFITFTKFVTNPDTIQNNR